MSSSYAPPHSTSTTNLTTISNPSQSSSHHHHHHQMPKNGTGLLMSIPGPLHLTTPPLPEPIAAPQPNLIAQMLQRDQQRLQNPTGLMNRVVFDCIDPSPMMGNGGGSSLANNQQQQGGDDSSVQNASSAAGSHHIAHVGQCNLPPYYQPLSASDNTLVFESRFESGNLRRAIQVYEYEYDLILKFDVNTRGHTQWFYFSVTNVTKGARYKFNLINLLKPDSLYNYGMKPLVYSEMDAKRKGRGWYRDGFDICYYQNNIKRKNGYFYTFTFSMEFQNDHDVYYFAYCYPYTYSNLQNYLANLEADPIRRKLFKRRTLCHTLAGNNCDVLTVTSFSCDPQALKNRKGVVVSARVHPGESNASWMMKGLIDFLTGPQLDAKILRDNFVFKIVPMLNPDGVINGNYRVSLSGFDLNRRWNDPSKKLHPTVHHTKQMIRQFMKEREVILYCDFHGHSRKKNIFMYGCCKTKKGGTLQSRLQTRVFPRILWKISQNFSYNDCSFNVQKSKESTARVVVHKELGLQNSYTIEASFCGASFGRNCDKHFNTRHLEQMGHYFCEAILDYCDPDQSRVQQVMKELEVLYPHEVSQASQAPAAEDDDKESLGSDDEETVSDAESASSSKKKKKGSKRSSKSAKKSKRSSHTSSSKNRRSASSSSVSIVTADDSSRSSTSRISSVRSRTPQRSTSGKISRKEIQKILANAKKVQDEYQNLDKSGASKKSKKSSQGKKSSSASSSQGARLRNRLHNTESGSSQDNFGVGRGADFEFESYRNFRNRLFGVASSNPLTSTSHTSGAGSHDDKSYENLPRLGFGRLHLNRVKNVVVVDATPRESNNNNENQDGSSA
eukprot:CAMPEP_0117437742 /NCGR_PEP_ID=MMETSP0759-20121206/1687_1 /TAXON_ID=63605 /ORGANISM="Percolomonas cosmopolitus, Strain WS" /LENGTH=840 /DNA_ID=CAMNT_0005229397 /DNA_START=1 /DNA_END=2523 /DNA_ORIENTATION=+